MLFFVIPEIHHIVFYKKKKKKKKKNLSVLFVRSSLVFCCVKAADCMFLLALLLQTCSLTVVLVALPCAACRVWRHALLGVTSLLHIIFNAS